LVLLLLSVLLLPRTLVYIPNRLEALENFTNHAWLAQNTASFLLHSFSLQWLWLFMGLNLLALGRPA